MTRTAHRLEFFTDEDGNPWACFAWGVVPATSITRERILEAADYYAGIGPEDLPLEDIQPHTFWIRDHGDKDDDYFDGPIWFISREDAEGAVRVTGITFGGAEPELKQPDDPFICIHTGRGTWQGPANEAPAQARGLR